MFRKAVVKQQQSDVNWVAEFIYLGPINCSFIHSFIPIIQIKQLRLKRLNNLPKLSYVFFNLSFMLSLTIWPEIAISHLSEIDYILFLMACGKIKWIKCSQHKTSFPKKKKKNWLHKAFY